MTLDNLIPTPAQLASLGTVLVWIFAVSVALGAIFGLVGTGLDALEDRRAKAAFRRDHQRAIQRPPTPLRLIAERRRLDGCDRKAQLDAIVRMGGSR